MSLRTHYDPQSTESKWYAFWEQEGLFRPENQPNSGQNSYFSIVIPPPNVTGTLHIGHALDESLQDILIRWHRMLGHKTLWMPGADHAGIATQSVVEKRLATQGQNRFELGREAFIEKVWEWARYSEGEIFSQFRRLGISPDWQRKRFTLDEGCSKAVRHAFYELHQAGLIYRGDYIVNWSVGLQSAISDIETEYSDEEGALYHITYPLASNPKQGITVATTRPETMFGDMAIAVHPEDDRYKALVGQTVKIPLTEIEIPIIADDYVEKDFGSGALKITPAHDPNDFEVGKRHNLVPVLIMSGQGFLDNAERVPSAFLNMERFEARKAISAALETQGYLAKKETHLHRVGRCQRSGTVVEPMLSKQWFVKTQPMAKQCLEALDKEEIRFVPSRWTKVYRDWMENIRDWCVSRQLWWGHQIPAWHCADCGQVTVALEDPNACEHCNSQSITQETDVLDTWFSSGLWPFSTMGWPDVAAPDFKAFYPTKTLVTGFDIIFFWVARMTMMGHQLTGQTPFDTVYIHGLVRDEQGQKMSKSKGNVVDPVEMIDEYGCDALRFALIGLVTYGGQDIKLSKERFEQGKLFCNKLWNAARFVLMNLEGVDDALPSVTELNAFDAWILTQLESTTQAVNQNLKTHRLGEALQLLYEFTWNLFCDWYVEAAKKGLKEESTKLNTQRVLRYVLDQLLRMMHPFMPFITEEIWQKLPFNTFKSISISDYPVLHKTVFDVEKLQETAQQVDFLIETVRCIRNTRQTAQVTGGNKLPVWIELPQQTEFEAIFKNQDWVSHFVKLESLKVEPQLQAPAHGAAVGVVGGAKVYVFLPDEAPSEEEVERQQAKMDKLQAEWDKLNGLMTNDSFLARAPQDVVEKNKQRLDELNEQLATLRTQLNKLQSLLIQ